MHFLCNYSRVPYIHRNERIHRGITPGSSTERVPPEGHTFIFSNFNNKDRSKRMLFAKTTVLNGRFSLYLGQHQHIVMQEQQLLPRCRELLKARKRELLEEF